MRINKLIRKEGGKGKGNLENLLSLLQHYAKTRSTVKTAITFTR